MERRDEETTAVIVLSRPEALNALSGAMAEEVAAAFHEVAGSRGVRAAVLAAAGDRAFCVGADLKERATLDDEGWHRNRSRMVSMFESIRSLPVPTIASVFGFALGGGFELALSCDLVVAADDSVFGLPETTVGLVPGGGGTQLLARRCGVARAKELIFSGRRLPVEEAHDWGIVNRVVPTEELSEATLGLAGEITKGSPVAAREAKAAVDLGLGAPLLEALELEERAWRRAVASNDRREGIAAWSAGRQPDWEDR